MTESRLRTSVAMCTYNGEAFVREQLESILRQTQLPDEIVISDDCSQDRTLEIVRETLAGCPFSVRILQNPENLGFIKNYEKAIREASGDLIFMCDFDDVWFPERISRMADAFRESPKVWMVYSNAELTDIELRPHGETVFERRKDRPLTAFPTAHQLGRGLGINGPMIAFRSALKPYILPLSNQWSQDHWITFIAFAVGEVRWVEQPLFYYRRHGQNLGSDPDLDGGFWYRLRVAARKSEHKQYAHRVRRFNDLSQRLHEIRDRGLPVSSQDRFNELLAECEDCLRFARLRENLKKRSRPLRVFTGLRSLVRGDYRHHAHGAKSFVQDIVIP